MTRQLHFGLHPYGVGGPGSDGLWKDPRVAKTASELPLRLGLPTRLERVSETRCTGVLDCALMVAMLGPPMAHPPPGCRGVPGRVRISDARRRRRHSQPDPG